MLATMARKKEPPPTQQRASVRLDAELKADLKVRAARDRRDMQDALDDAVRLYLETPKRGENPDRRLPEGRRNSGYCRNHRHLQAATFNRTAPSPRK
jgi:hypothetical protein